MNSETISALITGGTSGIGRAVANQLAVLGIRVIVAGRDKGRGLETVDHIRSTGGNAYFVETDLQIPSSVHTLAQRAIEIGNGHIDMLVNNAGIFPFGLTHETTEQDFDRVYSLNVKTPYMLVARLAPLMAKQGKGAIINVSSTAAENGNAGIGLYGSSKAALNHFTKVWAAEYGPSGVRVNTVSPGPTYTEGTESMTEALEQLAIKTIAGRPANVHEIARAIVFLLTDSSSYIYGAKLIVDGGLTAVE